MLLAPLSCGGPVEMPYQYPPQAVPGSYSNHSTPPSYWEVGNQQSPHLQDLLQHEPIAASPNQSTSISPQVFQQQLSPLESTVSLDRQQQPQPQQQASPTYEPPPTIQLQERAVATGNQLRFEHIDESHFQQQQESTEPRRHSTGKAVSRAGDEMRSSMSPSSAGVGPSRVTHGKTHALSHPYRRPSTAIPTGDTSARTAGVRSASASARMQQRECEVLGERSSRLRCDVPPTVGSSMALSCPAGAMHAWRIAALPDAESGDASVVQQVVDEASAVSGLHAISHEDQASLAQQAPTEAASFGLVPAAPPAIARPQLAKRMLIRTDVHFNAAANEMTAVFELPGLKKHDLVIKMYICPYSRVRQIIIMGRSRPVLPAGVYTVQERKFGDFYRTVAVPLDTKPEDIIAKMEDGILTLKVSCGMPAQEREEPAAITIH